MKEFDVTLRINLSGDGQLTATRTHTVEAKNSIEAISIASDKENKQAQLVCVCEKGA